MAEKQKLFWISKKTTFGFGDNALSYGDEVEGKIPEELIPRFKKSGEVGAVEMAKSDNVEIDAAFDKVEKELKAANEKLLEFQIVAENAVKVLKQDKLVKADKESLIADLEKLQ